MAGKSKMAVKSLKNLIFAAKFSTDFQKKNCAFYLDFGFSRHLGVRRLHFEGFFKIFFESILNEMHPKMVQIVLGRWRFSRFFSKKSHFCRLSDFRLPFWIFES
jgi:hypothetical protein